MACQNERPDFTLSIVSDSELLFHDTCKNKFTQKKIDEQGGPEDTYFTFAELKDIGAMLHDSPEFKTPEFESHHVLIVNLGKALSRPDITRRDLVGAILALMKIWLNMCKEDLRCILPPSLERLKDPNQQKQSILLNDLKYALQQQLTALASSTPPASLSATQTELVNAASAQALLRKL